VEIGHPVWEIEMRTSTIRSSFAPSAIVFRQTAMIASVVLLASACVGNITTPLPPSPTASTSFSCPVLPSTMMVNLPTNTCAGVRLSNLNLACSGGVLPLSLSTIAGGATRIDARLADGSLVTATATPVDIRCFDGISVQIGITIGLRYTGDLGQETTGPSTGSACIVRSRATFSQFVTADPVLIHPGVEDAIKDQIHQLLDTQLAPRRCNRWQLL
jgi:hypothetical protein